MRVGVIRRPSIFLYTNEEIAPAGMSTVRPIAETAKVAAFGGGEELDSSYLGYP